MACLAQLVNVIAPIMTSAGGLYVQPIYYPYLHASKYGRGVALNCLIESPKYESRDFGPVDSLDSIAVHNEEENTLTIFAVNRDSNSDIDAHYTLGGFAGYGRPDHLCMTSADLKAVNDMDCPDRVKPFQKSGAAIEGEKLRVVFPKLSWNVLRLGK